MGDTTLAEMFVALNGVHDAGTTVALGTADQTGGCCKVNQTFNGYREVLISVCGLIFSDNFHESATYASYRESKRVRCARCVCKEETEQRAAAADLQRRSLCQCKAM